MSPKASAGRLRQRGNLAMHALGAQVELLTKCLEEATLVGLLAAELYINALGEFGGVTTSLPS